MCTNCPKAIFLAKRELAVDVNIKQDIVYQLSEPRVDYKLNSFH